MKVNHIIHIGYENRGLDVDILRQSQFVDAVFEFVMLFSVHNQDATRYIEYIVRDTMPLMRVYQIQPNTKTPNDAW